VLTRKDNWPEELDTFFKSRRDIPFKMGENDCGLFACDAVKAMTGVDLAVKLRGTYTDAQGEEEVLRVLAIRAEIKVIPVKQARRGDIVMYTGDNGPGLLVVSGDGIHCLGPGESGIRSIPLDKCSIAWRI
jgi:hypothetical protein